MSAVAADVQMLVLLLWEMLLYSMCGYCQVLSAATAIDFTIYYRPTLLFSVQVTKDISNNLQQTNTTIYCTKGKHYILQQTNATIYKKTNNAIYNRPTLQFTKEPHNNFPRTNIITDNRHKQQFTKTSRTVHKKETTPQEI